MQCIDSIKRWTRTSLEENIGVTEDRTVWRKRSCAAGAANVRTGNADPMRLSIPTLETA